MAETRFHKNSKILEVMKRRRTDAEHDDRNPHKIEAEVSDSWISALPLAILLDIFFRLPINAIMKCKRVCRAWYKLLSDHSFSINYAKNSPFTTLLIPQYKEAGTSNYEDFFLLEITNSGDCFRTLFKPKVPAWSERNSSLLLVGSCNGLLCLLLSKRAVKIVYISNPLTSECIALPEHRNDAKNRSIALYRFGFCPPTGKFKVLRIVYSTYKHSEKGKAEIFTVGVDNGWRCLAEPFIQLSRWSEGIALCGAFHWILRDKGSMVIYTFDLIEEKVGQISPPPGLVLDFKRMDLALFNNQLCLIDCSVKSKLAIWTMKDYAVAESWTKDVILRSCFPTGLRFRAHAPSGAQLTALVPLARLQDGDVVFSYSAGNCLICYDIKEKNWTKIEAPDVGNIACFIMTFAANFASLQEVKIRGQWIAMNGSPSCSKSPV